MQIRLATHSDANDGSEVLRRSIETLCYPDHKGDMAKIAAWTDNKTPDMWKAWVSQDASDLYVAVEDHQIVGVGMIAHDGLVMLNYVSPDARWRGVSKALLAHMEAEVFSRGMRECSLKTTKTARAFYEAAGYCAEEGGGGDGYMTKRLSA